MYYRQYLPILSGVIPAFGDELSRFPWNMAVQKPLQQIFVVYMQCYEYMLQTFRDFPGKPATGLRVFADYVDQASHAIVRLEAEWEGAIAEASQEEVPAGLTQSEFSYFNGTLGPLRPKMTRALFEWQDTLGQGTFGQVSKVRETTTGTLYAQKTIRVIDQALKARIEKEVKNEVDIMQKLRHHHIASIQFHIFDGDTYSIMMLPVADCDLRQFLRRCVDAEYPSGDIAYLTSWFRCLISALAYAHSRNIKHEDIKPANILIKDHQPYLTDFGCAKDFSGWDSSTSMDTLTFGTPVYWAPESQPRGRGADVFSLGCVFSEMLTVIYKRSLRDYQDYRYVQDGENAYAFRENLAKVRDWLDDIVPQSQSTGILIKEQTLQMLEPDVERRKKARDIVDSFRVLGNGICATC